MAHTFFLQYYRNFYNLRTDTHCYYTCLDIAHLITVFSSEVMLWLS